MANAVLIVEDEIAVARVLERALTLAGYEVAIASNGRAALELLRQRSFAAVLSDIRMPQMGGQELCERIRAEHLAGDPFLFVLSSIGEEDQIAWTRDVPRLEFVPKPISARRLTARLATILGGRERTAEDPA